MSFPEQPYCECGSCDSLGKEVLLPPDAWEVAGCGNLSLLAVHEDHLVGFDHPRFTVDRHVGWAAVGLK